jgi:DNA modification methylase
MKIKKIEINKLKPAQYNPRQITKSQFNQLKESIKKFGLVDPIIINQNGNIVVGGHQRLKAMQQLNHTEIECVVLDLTPEEEKELNIRLNKNGGEWDFDLLSNFDIEELKDWGFKEIELGLNIDKITEGNTEDDHIPEVKESRVKLGDVWQLGKHRLMCGDSTKESDVEKLMNGEKAEISFTSPPYNAGQTPTETKTNKKSKYINDLDNKSNQEYVNFLQTFTKLSLEYSEYSFVNIQSLAGNKTALIDYLYLTKDIYAETIIWNKQSAQPAMAENVLNSQFEYIHIFSKKANRSIGTKHFRGTLSNLINISKQTKNKVKEHNATFSIDFALHFVNNFSNKIVLDLFLGSGTTLIACEKTNRICYGMELDTKYCDVIIERWEQFTGQKAIKCGV